MKSPALLLLTLPVLLLANCTHAALEDREHWMREGQVRLKDVLNRRLNTKTAKNVIVFVGDGMGVATVTAARIFKGQQRGRPDAEKEFLAYEKFPDVGLIKTYNVDKQVPDSAGTGTAIFTGVKTNYGLVGVDATMAKGKCEAVQMRRAALDSLMRWAQKAGRLTGLVTTTRVTHATPATTYGRTPHREWECDSSVPPEAFDCVKDLARQLVEDEPGRNFKVILGGGLSPMGVQNSSDPNEDVCRRSDGRNLALDWLDYQKRQGVRAAFARNWGELMSVDPRQEDAVLGLFATSHMEYEVERRRGPGGSPSLQNMTTAAIRMLQKGKKGFVLMVEGGLIDQAHHQNWARLALTEAVGMEAAVEAALKMTSREDTLVIVTADHSHAMTMNGYPRRGNDILGIANSGWNKKRQAYETLSYANGPGYHDHLNNGSGADGMLWLDPGQMAGRQDTRYRHFAPIWSDKETHGGEDIAVYATGPFSHLFNGVHEQNYIAHAISCAGRFGPNAHLCKSAAAALGPTSLGASLAALLILKSYLTSN